MSLIIMVTLADDEKLAALRRLRRHARRSRRPQRSSQRIAPGLEEQIGALRKSLAEAGLDAGAATIAFHLAARHWQGPCGLDYLAGPDPARVRHHGRCGDERVQENERDQRDRAIWWAQPQNRLPWIVRSVRRDS